MTLVRALVLVLLAMVPTAAAPPPTPPASWASGSPERAARHIAAASRDVDIFVADWDDQ